MSRMRSSILSISALWTTAVSVFLFCPGATGQEAKTQLEARSTGEKIAVVRKGLDSSDIHEKEESICFLGELGGEAIPILLEQLETELKRGERISSGGESKDAESRFLGSVILALGHTKDRRSIPPLIAIVLSRELSVNARWDAAQVLSVLASPELLPVPSTFVPQAKPAAGYELTEQDREEVKTVLIGVLKDQEPSMRMEAVIGLGMISDPGTVSLLTSIAQEDPYSEEIDASLRGGKKGDKIKIYPVREEAEKLLKRLEERQRIEGREKGEPEDKRKN